MREKNYVRVTWTSAKISKKVDKHVKGFSQQPTQFKDFTVFIGYWKDRNTFEYLPLKRSWNRFACTYMLPVGATVITRDASANGLRGYTVANNGRLIPTNFFVRPVEAHYQKATYNIQRQEESVGYCDPSFCSPVINCRNLI
jgi:hypothetical protein